MSGKRDKSSLIEEGSVSSASQVNTWSSTKVLTAYQEGRKVLNSQQSRRKHVDSKALQTGRVTTVITTIAISLISGLGLQVHPILGIMSGLLLIAAFGFAITSYTTESLYLGPSGDYLGDMVIEKPGEKLAVGGELETDPWELSLVLMMGHWIDENYKIHKKAKLRLMISEVALFSGIVFFVLGVGL